MNDEYKNHPHIVDILNSHKDTYSQIDKLLKGYISKKDYLKNPFDEVVFFIIYFCESSLDYLNPIINYHINDDKIFWDSKIEKFITREDIIIKIFKDLRILNLENVIRKTLKNFPELISCRVNLDRKRIFVFDYYIYKISLKSKKLYELLKIHSGIHLYNAIIFGQCDLTELILETYPKPSNFILYSIPHTFRYVEPIMIVLNKYQDFFKNFEDFSIEFEDSALLAASNLVKVFYIQGLNKKVNFFSLSGDEIFEYFQDYYSEEYFNLSSC